MITNADLFPTRGKKRERKGETNSRGLHAVKTRLLSSMHEESSVDRILFGAEGLVGEMGRGKDYWLNDDSSCPAR